MIKSEHGEDAQPPIDYPRLAELSLQQQQQVLAVMDTGLSETAAIKKLIAEQLEAIGELTPGTSADGAIADVVRKQVKRNK